MHVTSEDTKLESETRVEIDKKLTSAGWVVQDKKTLNLFESLGVAVREMDTDTGPADYMLFINGKACGIIEAKREGTDLGGVAEQSARYATSHTKHIERWVPEEQALPFLYEATNHEIRFRDERDPHPRSRFVFHFHKPETLKKWLDEGKSLRDRLLNLPELNTQGLRDCQIDAVHGIEKSLKQAKPRALLQMATSSGKTYTAVTQVYRLAKFAKVKQVLFLVDRGNLATNAKDEFEQFVIPNDGRKFTQLYKAEDRSQRTPTWSDKNTDGRWREYTYEEIIARDKTNLDIFWLIDDSLEDTENLPTPEILALEIVEQLEAALVEFRSVEEILGTKVP